MIVSPAMKGTILVLWLFLAPLVEARLALPVMELNSGSIDAFLASNDKIMVDFFDPNDPDWKKDKEALNSALMALRDNGKRMKFAKVDVIKEKELAARYVPNGRYPQLIWFAHGQPTRYHRTLRATTEIVEYWKSMDRELITTIDKVGQIEYKAAILAEIPKSGPLYKILDTVALKHMNLAVVYHIESDKGTISWYEERTSKKVYDGDGTVKSLDKWMRGILPLTSEPIPEGDMIKDGDTTIVVADNFADVVLNDEKDILFMFYAPWCGYCRKFMPDWNKLATYLAKADHLTVAKMDATQNQLVVDDEEWVANAFPTVFYKKAGTTYPIPFSAKRTIDNLLAYVKEHSTKPINLGEDGANATFEDERLFDL